MQTTIDWNQVINTFIATLPILIGAITGLLTILKQINVIHTATNSMKDALVAATAKASLAEGIAKGMADEQVKAAAAAAAAKPAP